MSDHDPWAEWVLRRRTGDGVIDPSTLQRLTAFRDLVLEGAHLRADDHVLDVGAGDGLVGFGALQRLGEPGRVTFSDVSTELLDVCRRAASDLGLGGRCTFVQASADDLSPFADASVDVVMTRSVLAYVAAKDRAFAEFHRVLRGGGRISLFEPINRFMFPEPTDEFLGYRADGVEDLVVKIRGAACSSDEGPMLAFDDGTLARLAEAAGFTDIEVILRRGVLEETSPMDWERFVGSSPNPLAPSWGDAIAGALTPEEQARFSAVMRPRFADGHLTVRHALATVTATKRSGA